jgi:hypothetical protein
MRGIKITKSSHDVIIINKNNYVKPSVVMGLGFHIIMFKYCLHILIENSISRALKVRNKCLKKNYIKTAICFE